MIALAPRSIWNSRVCATIWSSTNGLESSSGRSASERPKGTSRTPRIVRVDGALEEHREWVDDQRHAGLAGRFKQQVVAGGVVGAEHDPVDWSASVERRGSQQVFEHQVVAIGRSDQQFWHWHLPIFRKSICYSVGSPTGTLADKQGLARGGS
jgi:hypothetical protein